MDRWGSAPAAGAFQSGLLVAVAPPLYPGTTPPTKSRNSPAADAAAQRHRSLEHDAQNGLAALFTTGALMALKTGPPRDWHDAIKEKIGLVLALSVGLLSCGSGVRGKP